MRRSRALVPYQPPRSPAAGAGGRRRRRAHVPVEGRNTLRSNAVIRVVDLISEGEIKGLVTAGRHAGLESVHIDGVQVFSQYTTPAGKTIESTAVSGLSMNFLNGLPDQQAVNLDGFDGVEREVAVGEELLQDDPVVRTINTPAVKRVRVTARFPRLVSTATNGNTGPAGVKFKIDYRPAGGAWTPALPRNFGYYRGAYIGGLIQVTDKNISPAELQWEFRIYGAKPCEIRLTRINPNSESDKLHNDIIWQRFTEIIPSEMLYPHSAVAAIKAEADEFTGGTVANREYDVYGLIVQVPTNYDPQSRQYSGLWDGTFKRAWTDNGAWLAYHLLGNTRFGLGREITPAQLSAAKWEFYACAQFNDHLVSDGEGGHEPRFRCTGVVNKATEAKRLLDHLLGNFNAALYYGAGFLAPAQDRPEDPALLVSNANVIDGDFEYEDLPHSERVSAVAMSFNDPEDGYKLGIELVVDDDLVAKYGYKQADRAAMFCTSRGQAQRMARYFLRAQERESDTLTYRAGLDHAALRPGAIIKQTDTHTAGARHGLRLAEYIQVPDLMAADHPAHVVSVTNNPLIGRWSYTGEEVFFDSLWRTAFPPEADLRIDRLLFCNHDAAPANRPQAQFHLRRTNPRQHLAQPELYALLIKFYREYDGTRELADTAYLPFAAARPGHYRYNWDYDWYHAQDPPQTWVDAVCRPWSERPLNYNHPGGGAGGGKTWVTHIDAAIVRVADLERDLPPHLALKGGAGAYIRADSLAGLDLAAGPWKLNAMLPSGAVEQRAVTPAAANYLKLDRPFSAAPIAGAMAMLEHANAPARLWRVLSVAETDALEFQVKCRAHDPHKYTAVEDATFIDRAAIAPAVPAGPLPAPAAVNLEEEVYLEGLYYRSRLNIGVTDAAPDPRATLVEIQWRSPSTTALADWQPLAVQGARTAARDANPGHEYQARARLRDGSGTLASAWVESPPLRMQGKTTPPDYSTDPSVRISSRLLPSGEEEFTITRPSDPAFQGWIFYERDPATRQWIERGRWGEFRGYGYAFKIRPRMHFWGIFEGQRGYSYLTPSGLRYAIQPYPNDYAFRGFDTSYLPPEDASAFDRPGSGLSPNYKTHSSFYNGFLYESPVIKRRGARLFIDFSAVQTLTDVFWPIVRWVIQGSNHQAITGHQIELGEVHQVDAAQGEWEVPEPYFHRYNLYPQTVLHIPDASTLGWFTVDVPDRPPSAPEVTVEVVDSVVMFDYRADAGSAPIQQFELRKGPDFATAELIATQAGQSSNMVRAEKVAGQFVYWWRAIDTAGRAGEPARVSATVESNPDTLANYSSYAGRWRGQKTRIHQARDRLFLPVQDHTWAQHFSAARPNIQHYISQGLRFYAQPTGGLAGAAGIYREAWDYGSVIADAIVHVRPRIVHLGGYPPNAQGERQQPTIKVERSLDAAAWSDAGITDLGVISNFRHLRVTLTMPRVNEKSYAELDDILVTLTRPTFTTLAGTATATSSAGVWVPLAAPAGQILLASEPPIIHPFGDASVIGNSDQDARVSMPTGFRVKLYTSTGARTAGKFRWQVQAILTTPK